jgi:hypothetical protein
MLKTYLLQNMLGFSYHVGGGEPMSYVPHMCSPHHHVLYLALLCPMASHFNAFPMSSSPLYNYELTICQAH